MGSIKNAFKFIFSPTASRTTGILVILIIVLAIPLTVIVSQRQQELRQRAADTTIIDCQNQKDQCVNQCSQEGFTPEEQDTCVSPCYIALNNCLASLPPSPTPTSAVPTPTATPISILTPAAQTPTTTPSSSTLCSQGSKYRIFGRVVKRNGEEPKASHGLCIDPAGSTACSSDKFNTTDYTNGSYTLGEALVGTPYNIYLTSQNIPKGFKISSPNPVSVTTCSSNIYDVNFTLDTIDTVPIPTPAIPTPKACSGTGYWCYGPADASNALASGCKLASTNFDCKLSDGSNGPTWGTCYSGCPVSQTPTSRDYNNTSTGNSQSTGVAPTYSPGPTSIPAGYITLYFNVVLPGMSPIMTTAPITATLYQGSSPIGPFSNISLTRQTNSDIFTGDSGTKIRISDIAVGQDYYVEVKAQSYEKQIITGGEQKNPQGLRTVFNNSTLPSVKLRPGDIDGNGTIDGADYGILVACFGNKNIFTGATGRTDCGNKTNNGQFNPDINKDGKVVGDDINLLWRAVNGTL